ncbi:MAG: hypothetical protein JXA09_01025 [Anaerolineae bacterium]|nr:hypothetical protein [Anaerolineae bacterium]
MVEGLFSTGFGPILVLWIGALVFYVLDRYLEPQDRGSAEVVVLILALGFLIEARTQIGVPMVHGHALAALGWAGTTPFTILSRETWLLSLLLVGAAAMAALSSIGTATAGRAGRMAILGAALLFLTAGDWTTAALSWLLVDLALLGTLNARGVSRERLGWVGGLSLCGPILIGVALAVWESGGAHAWVDRGGPPPMAGLTPAAIPPLAAAALAVAALLRLMPYPLPTWFGAAQGAHASASHPAPRVLLTGVPALLGAVMWARLAGWGGLEALPAVAAPAVWGGVALLVGAARAWGAREPEQVVASLHALPGATVLLAVGPSTPEPWLVVVGASGVLATVALYVAWTQCQHLDLYDVHTYWRAAPTLVALASLAGVPLCAGFPARAAIYWGAFTDGRWAALALAVVGEALFLSALLQVLLELECVVDLDQVRASGGTPSDSPADLGAPACARARRVLATASRRARAWLRQVREQEGLVYGASALVALALLVLGVAPRAFTGAGLGEWLRLLTLPMWAALLLPVAGAFFLYRSRDRLLDVWSAWWPLFERLLSLDAVYRGIGRALKFVGSVLWGGMLLVEGAGYMAWVMLVCLVILLFVIAR